MRMSQLFSRTLRDIPSEADVSSHQLLLRAGFIRQLAAGIFNYLPLGHRTLAKIENIMRQEMEAIGGQEMSMPVVHPADVWKESGRWYQIDAEMGRFKDRADRDMVLAMTHEEVVANLVRTEVQSYRQLPMLIYHIQTKWRDDPRPRAGLIRAREFTMKDSYSLDATWEGLDAQYRAHYHAYFNIFNRCRLPVIAVKSDVGMMGGQMAHEFMYLNANGEDTLIICPACGYSANRQVARIRKPESRLSVDQAALPIEKVTTPGAKTIDDLAKFLDITQAQTAKAVFLIATMSAQTGGSQEKADGITATLVEQFIFAIVRGDTEVNETKLANVLKARSLRPATEAEIRSVGAVPGYASPIGLSNALVIVDDLIPNSPNLVAGANEEGYHLLNVNYGRDYQAQIVADITVAQAGDGCPECGAPLLAERGVETGNIFKLGTRYSDAMGCTFIDADGSTRPVIMGSYGIGSGRLMACIAEQNHDEYGLIWPISVAPYQVHLVYLASKASLQTTGEKVMMRPSGAATAPSFTLQLAETVYRALWAAGIEVLFDDREESPGVKFNDADLIGLPIRLTVSERALKQGGVEIKYRLNPEKSILPLDPGDLEASLSSLVGQLLKSIDGLRAEIERSAVTVPFE